VDSVKALPIAKIARNLPRQYTTDNALMNALKEHSRKMIHVSHALPNVNSARIHLKKIQ